MIFVFSVNISQLQYTIKHYYGNEYDGCRYLDRFFDFRIALPQPDMDKFYNLIGLLSYNYPIDKIMLEMIKRYNMSMREVMRYINYCNIAANVSCQIKGGYQDESLEFLINVFTPIMIGIRMLDISGYELLLKGENEKILETILNKDSIRCLLDKLFDDYNHRNKNDNRSDEDYSAIIKKLNNALFEVEYKIDDTGKTLGAILINHNNVGILHQVINLFSSITDLEGIDNFADLDIEMR